MKPNLKIIGLLGAIAVMLGALGAHALKQVLTPEQVSSFQTGVRYHLIHTVVLFVIYVMAQKSSSKNLMLSYNFFTIGIIFFSFSIYLLNLRHIFNAEWLKVLGPITPIGGVLLITGWIFLGFSGKTYVSNKGE